MSLYDDLLKAESEEDVKACYIEALGLRGRVHLGKVDIKSKDIWFESKNGKHKTLECMFAQAICYLNTAVNDGSDLPRFLCAIDVHKAGIIEVSKFIDRLHEIDFTGIVPSDVPKSFVEKISSIICPHIVSFNMKTQDDQFINFVKESLEKGEFVKTQITMTNLCEVFNKWCDDVIFQNNIDRDTRIELFYVDIMSDNSGKTKYDFSAKLAFTDGEPVFTIRKNNKDYIYTLKCSDGYKKFWSKYQRPPIDKIQNELLRRRDSLIPLDERSFKGAFYTIPNLVKVARKYIADALGDNWEKEYTLYDPCCGVFNLELFHTVPRNIFASTLDAHDIEIGRLTKVHNGACVWQYDYLNDDITDDGAIDYSLTNKTKGEFRKLSEMNKKNKNKILILMNPPYKEAGHKKRSVNDERNSSEGVSHTAVQRTMMQNNASSHEIFIQFLTRIQREFPNAVIGVFSTMKYIVGEKFKKFRDEFHAEFNGGFLVHSKIFDGITGDFPIVFALWKLGSSYNSLSQIPTIDFDMYGFATKINKGGKSKELEYIGQKDVEVCKPNEMIKNWYSRPLNNKNEFIPLSNALEAIKGKCFNSKICDGFLGYADFVSDTSHSMYTAIYSGYRTKATGVSITKDNMKHCLCNTAISLVMQKCKWFDHESRFYMPSEEPSEEFYNDCIIYSLFHNCNNTSTAILQWDNKEWEIVNHFIPFTELQVNAQCRFKSTFMSDYLSDKELSLEARNVYYEGLKIWRQYFQTKFSKKICDRLQLCDRDGYMWDAGWYQIRQAFKELDGDLSRFDKLREYHSQLGVKIRDIAFELNMIR